MHLCGQFNLSLALTIDSFWHYCSGHRFFSFSVRQVIPETQSESENALHTLPEDLIELKFKLRD